jgi:hypothetical protein
VLRAETNDPSNDYAQNPRVTSDGTNWIVVWEDSFWQGTTRLPNIAGVRVAPDGTLIDPEPVVIHQQFSVAFPPILPDVAFAGDELLVVWDDFGEVFGRRVDLALQPLDPASFLVANFAAKPRVASNGADFLVVDTSYRGYRVTHDGQVLDPGGIDFDAGGNGWQPMGPAVAWDGVTYSIPFGSSETTSSDSDLWEARIDPAGNVSGPVKVLESADFEWKAAVAPAGGGAAQIVWARRDEQLPEDIRGLRRAADGSTGPPVDVGIGMHRQAYLRFASNGDEHLGIFLSTGGGQRRLMAQRVTSDGIAIDPEPKLITAMSELYKVVPDVAFNGAVYLVAWADRFGSILGQRLWIDGSPIDPAPVTLIHQDSAAGNFAIGALGGDFLVTYSHRVSGDLRYLKAARVRGSDLTVLDTPFFIGFNFANNPRVAALGDSWLVVWESQTRHDRSSSTIRGIFVSESGVPGTSFSINSSGLGDDPDLAVTGNRALVAWWDSTTLSNTSLAGRLIEADGSLPGPQFLIADANNDQRQPAVAWDGSQFVVAWMDFREVQGVEHERADIYAARVGFDGNVLDPGGFQVTGGTNPEEYPDLAGSGDRMTIAFSILHGELEPEVQRIGKRVLGGVPSTVTEIFESIAAEDGFVREAGEHSSVGGFHWANGAGKLGLRLGDNANDAQIKTIVSFDTSSIPPGATIASATLRLRRKRVVNANPFDTIGTALVDIKTGGFSGNPALQNSDFEAVPDAAAVATMSNPTAFNDYSEGVLSAAGLAAINTGGRTQLRVGFSPDDNDNNALELVGFRGGQAVFAHSRPQLVVTYVP